MTNLLRSFASSFALVIAIATASCAQTPADNWLAKAGIFPAFGATVNVRSNFFLDLRTEVVAGRLKVVWNPDAMNTATQHVVVRASPGLPGHWPARDWRSHAMLRRDQRWEAALPVEDLDEPIIYFVEAAGIGRTNLSPMRLVTPRAAGLEEPTRPFWSFLEGFEEGLESWRLLADGKPGGALRLDPEARTGRAALAVGMSKPENSIVVATTRLRGWQLQQRNATGIRLWARTRAGPGTLRFALRSNALTRDQFSSAWPGNISVSNRWQRVDLFFSDLGESPLGAVDMFTIQFTADLPAELLLDDLQLLGPWRIEP